MAAPTTRLVIIKRFTYRGNANEEWSNSYMLTGATPADNAAWRTLFDDLVALERGNYTSATSVVGGYGYNSMADTATAIWSVDLTVAPNSVVAGQLPTSGGTAMAGDQAAWIRWGLDRFNSKGKRIYLRKYFHDGRIAASPPDNLLASYSTALGAYGAALWGGSVLGGRKMTDKLGTNVVGHAVSPYVTTRTLKRRGKRPPT